MSTPPDPKQFAGSPYDGNRAASAFDAAILEGFIVERERLSCGLPRDVRRAALELKESLPPWRAPDRGIGGLGSKFSNLSTLLRQRFTPSTYSNLSKFLVTELVLSLDAKLIDRDLPDEVLTLYPAAAARLLSYIRESADDDYCFPDESFLKDVRFASGLSVPCGAVSVDLRSGLGYRTSVRWLLRGPRAVRRYARSYIHSGQVFPWFRVHLDSRYLGDFSEPGWDASYMRIAALLRRHSGVFGMVSTSWFYDPQLTNISPRLTYLRSRPMERGATIVRNGTSDFAVNSAIAKSKTRRRLYEQREYLPVAYSLVWPREALLAWADARLGSS